MYCLDLHSFSILLPNYVGIDWIHYFGAFGVEYLNYYLKAIFDWGQIHGKARIG